MSWSAENKCKVKLGGNYYINCPNLIVYKGETLFSIVRRDSDGLIGINFDIYNKEGSKVATIRRGSIVDGDKENYNLTHNSHHYQVVEKETKKVICDIKRKENVSQFEMEVSVDLYTKDGFHILATPTHTNIGGSMLIGNTIEANIGIAIN